MLDDGPDQSGGFIAGRFHLNLIIPAALFRRESDGPASYQVKAVQIISHNQHHYAAQLFQDHMGQLQGLRNALVIVQFTISIALIAGTIIVFQQLKFISSANLGFDKQNVLLIKYAEKLGNHLEAFRNEVETYPGVVDAGVTMEVPGGGVWSDGLSRENSDVNVSMTIVKTDEHFFKTLDFKLATGRAFEKDRPADKNTIILNETAARLFGWTPEQAYPSILFIPGMKTADTRSLV